MKNIFKIGLIGLTCLSISSCKETRQILGYDNTEEKFNTNLFYKNSGEVQAADPHVIYAEDKFYMYATNANSNGDCSYLQVWSSENLTNWTNEGICYQPELTNWAIDGLWAPEVIAHEGKYYLYYSGWDIKRGGHQIGVAVSDNPFGPFVKQEDPVMMTQYSWDYVSGTGHCSLFKSPDGKEVFMAYHSHLDTLLGGAERIINFDRVNFVDGKVIVNGPSISPQILPSGVGEYRDLKDEMQVLVNGVPIYQLYDGIINVFEDELDNEVNLMMNKVKITIVFNEVKTIRGIMIYDSANCDYSLKSIDSIVINNKKIKNLKINDKYFSDDDYLYKIPVSSFIYEFDEITTNKIEINISSDDVIYLNEIKVIGK